MKFSGVQQRMLDVLSDGLSHTPKELQACLHDELGSITNIRAHLTHLRKKLRPMGSDVLCEMLNGETMYRQVRMMRPSDE